MEDSRGRFASFAGLPPQGPALIWRTPHAAYWASETGITGSPANTYVISRDQLGELMWEAQIKSDDREAGQADRTCFGEGTRPVTGTVYRSRTVMQAVELELRQAQHVLTVHALDLAGRCVRCDAPGPCWDRSEAVHPFSFDSRLPSRVPGASRPALLGTRRH